MSQLVSICHIQCPPHHNMCTLQNYIFCREATALGGWILGLQLLFQTTLDATIWGNLSSCNTTCCNDNRDVHSHVFHAMWHVMPCCNGNGHRVWAGAGSLFLWACCLVSMSTLLLWKVWEACHPCWPFSRPAWPSQALHTPRPLASKHLSLPGIDKVADKRLKG